MNDDLGDRMKQYEQVSKIKLTARMPMIIRLDGKGFHNFTRGFDKPFDSVLMDTMQYTMNALCANVSGTKLGYSQSDEISLLVTDYENINTQAWFDKSIQKIVSVSASMATMFFNRCFSNAIYTHRNEVVYNRVNGSAIFDSRCFILPKEEVTNYFIWRQQDATRNAIQMVAHANFSHKELQNKNSSDLQEMLFTQKGINFNDLPVVQKRGSCSVKELFLKDDVERSRWIVDEDIPIFTENREYIEKRL